MKKKQKQHYTGKKWIAALVVIVLIFAAIYYYIALPAINIHNPELWKFVLFVLVIAFALYALPKTTFTGDRRHPVNFSGSYKTKTFKLLAALIVIIAAAYFVGTLLSSPIINASKYQKLMKVEKSKFTKDIDQISYDQIPLLDKSSAEILGARKMGSLVDLANTARSITKITRFVSLRFAMRILSNGLQIKKRAYLLISKLTWQHSRRNLFV